MKTVLVINLSILFLLPTFRTIFHLGRHKTTIAPASWSEWGPWDQNCSVTCGIGIRRRVRTCSYTGNKRKLRCKGNGGEMKNCDTELTCPVDGTWSAWVVWDCTVSCGGGNGRQKRTCTNPKPMFNGKECEGVNEEYGVCNAHKCPDQVYTLSPGTAQSLRDAIESIHFSFEKREGSNIELSCASKLVDNIYKEYPSSVLFWTKNGKVLDLDIERMQLSLTELSIMELNPEDSGVYLCSMRYAPDVVKPLTVATVAVIPKMSTVNVPEEESWIIICHGVQLGKVYKDLTQAWLLNEVVYKDFGNASVLESNLFELDNVSANMTGIWKCKVSDSKRGWTWTTNIIRLQVLPPLPLHLKLVKNRGFLVLLGVSGFVTVAVVGICIGYKITKARANFASEFQRWTAVSAFEKHKARKGTVPAYSESSDEYSRSSDDDTREPSAEEEES